MITLKEAYLLFRKKFPDTKCDSITDWGTFYTCSNSISNDLVDDTWKIDKNTGKITEQDLIQLAKDIDIFETTHDISELKTYKISDIL